MTIDFRAWDYSPYATPLEWILRITLEFAYEAWAADAPYVGPKGRNAQDTLSVCGIVWC